MQRAHPDTAPVRFLRDDAEALRLFAPLGRERLEVCAFAYLDPQWRLIGLRHTRSGLSDLVRVSLRDVVRDALALEASRVVMAHNHPSGDVRPSGDDVRLTRRLARALESIGVRLADHVILTAGSGVSMRGEAMI